MRERIKSLGRFGFYFTTAVYLLALPVYAFLRGGDALLPYEAGLCTALSTINGGLAARSAWKAIK